MIAVVSDGTRVLGLGDIGPEAGLPVMEGKALLFKYMGGVDAVPICLDTKDPDELIRTVRLLSPSFEPSTWRILRCPSVSGFCASHGDQSDSRLARRSARNWNGVLAHC
ncbi:MAG: hypothetical protein MRJ92_01670 [Nitrospira sp.]|nr:hypothetical protein [Nitrospira sp.]